MFRCRSSMKMVSAYANPSWLQMMRQKDGFLSLKLPGGLGEANEITCQNLLTGLMVYLQSLSEEYPDYLAVRLDDDDEEA